MNTYSDTGANFYKDLFLNGIPLPTFLVNMETLSFLSVNDAAIRHYGYSRDEFLSMTIRDIRPPEEVGRLMAYIRQLKPGRFHAGVWQHLKKDGTVIEVEVSIGLKRMEGEHIAVVVASVATERERAAAEIFDLYNNAPCGYHSVDRDGIIVRINDTILKWLDYSRDEILGRKRFADLLTPKSKIILDQQFALLQQVGEFRGAELELNRRDGTILPVLVSSSAIKDDAGQFVMSRCVVFNITERKQAEARLSLYEKIFSSTNEAIVILDRFGRILEQNATHQALYGYTDEELKGQTPALILGEQTFSRIRKELSERDSYNGEVVCRSRAGTELIVELSLISIRDATGEILCHVGIKRDITDRKWAEKALRESEARYRELVEHAVYGIYRSTLDGKFAEVNPALVAMLGYSSKAELLGLDLPVDLYRDPEHRGRLIAQHRESTLMEGIEVPWKRKDGTPLLVRLRGRGLRDERGTLQGFECMVEDVTERRALEHQLRMAQKMEAVGRLAGGIAHDFNNLLSIIIGYSEVLMERLHPGDPLFRQAEEIRKAGFRAASLTKQLLAFSRKQVLDPKVLNLNSVMTDMEHMLRRVIGEDIDLTVAPGPALWKVRADQGQIEQVILNLAINARDAMPQGGKLLIETANVELGEGYARQHVPMKPGRYVLVAVSDTGIGMDRETEARIFEPFFTTKGMGKGTGLGLATVYGIVKQSGGFIWVYSEPRKGTTFKIYLPQTDEPFKKTAPEVTRPSSIRGSETILLVEDDESLRKLTHEFLAQQDYEVIEASNGAQAIEIARRHPKPIQLLVTDVVMPGMSGPELAKHLGGLRPQIKVLFVSGYTDDAIVHHGVLEPGTPFLEKPFTQDALTRKVRELLDGGNK